jgi:hypothetical protein
LLKKDQQGVGLVPIIKIYHQSNEPCRSGESLFIEAFSCHRHHWRWQTPFHGCPSFCSKDVLEWYTQLSI